MRKTKEIVINDRGTNKTFKITEMAASLPELAAHPDFSPELREALAVRLLDAEQERYDRIVRQKIIADTLLKDGLKSLGNVNLADAKELYDDLLKCCELKSDNYYMPLDIDTIDGQVESVKTLFTLRKEALMLHLDFLDVAAPLTSATAAKSATSIIKPVRPKTSAR